MYHLWFVFFFLGYSSTPVTVACPVTTDLIMRVNVRTTSGFGWGGLVGGLVEIFIVVVVWAWCRLSDVWAGLVEVLRVVRVVSCRVVLEFGGAARVHPSG